MILLSPRFSAWAKSHKLLVGIFSKCFTYQIEVTSSYSGYFQYDQSSETLGASQHSCHQGSLLLATYSIHFQKLESMNVL